MKVSEEPRKENPVHSTNKLHSIKICWRKFRSWIWEALRDKHNLPHWIIAVFTLLLVVFACTAWEESLQGTAAMQGQLQIMAENQRPWVTANITPIESIIDIHKLPTIVNDLSQMRNDDGGRVNFKVVLTNVGHSPAFHVTVWMEGIVFGAPRHDAQAAQKALCEQKRSYKADPQDMGNAILPGQTIEWKQMGVNSYAGWSKDDAQTLGFNLNDHHRIMMFAYGCVDYLFGDPFAHHQTGFLYILDSDKFTQGEMTNSIPTDVPLDEMSIHAYPYATSNMRTD